MPFFCFIYLFKQLLAILTHRVLWDLVTYVKKNGSLNFEGISILQQRDRVICSIKIPFFALFI